MEFDSITLVDYPTQTARPRNGSIFIPRVRFLYSLHTSLQSWPMLLHRGWRVEETIHTSAPVIMAEGWCGPFPSLQSSRRSESTTRVTRLVCSKVSCDGSRPPHERHHQQPHERHHGAADDATAGAADGVPDCRQNGPSFGSFVGMLPHRNGPQSLL